MRWFTLFLPIAACGEPPPVVEVPSSVRLGEIRQCSDPRAQVSYTEVGTELGIQESDSNPENHEEDPSLAVEDLNGDGFDDLLYFPVYGTKCLYWFDGEEFDRDTIPNLPGTVGITVTDVDADGDLDLLLAGPAPAPHWLKNRTESDATSFVWDEGDLPGLDLSTAASTDFSHEFSIGDLNTDGLPDYYLSVTANIDVETELFSDTLLTVDEDGSLEFTESSIPEDVGLRHTFDATWFDADADGDLDLYLANDFGSLSGESTLLRNDDGTLVDASDDCLCSLLTNKKGVDVGDFNGDGLPDLYVTGNPENTLLQQLDDGTFVNVTATLGAEGVDDPVTGWGGIFLDYDNDGSLDILSAQGDRWNVGNDLPREDVYPKLLKQSSSGSFEDIAEDMGLDLLGSYRGVIANDFNADGVLDLVLSMIGTRPYLYMSDGCTANNWIEVNAPIGSRVEVTADGITHTAWVKKDSGYLAQGPARVHFGLGSSDVLDSLRVVFPGGEEVFTEAPIEARRQVTVDDIRFE